MCGVLSQGEPVLPYLWLLSVLRHVGLGILSLYEERDPIVHVNLNDINVAVDDPFPEDAGDSRCICRASRHCSGSLLMASL